MITTGKLGIQFIIILCLGLGITACEEDTQEHTQTNSLKDDLINKVWEPMYIFESGQEQCDGEIESIQFYLDGTHQILYPADTILGTYTVIDDYIYLDNTYRLAQEEKKVTFQTSWKVTANYETVLHIRVESTTKSSPINCDGFVLYIK